MYGGNYAWDNHGPWHIPLGVGKKTCLFPSPLLSQFSEKQTSKSPFTCSHVLVAELMHCPVLHQTV